MDCKKDHVDHRNVLADLKAQTDPLEVLVLAQKAIKTTLPELRANADGEYDICGRKLSGSVIANLIDGARIVRAHSYAPYSHFNVGAGILAEDRHGIQERFGGVNIENAAYGSTVCAERAAAFAAVTAGYRRFLAYAVVGDFDGSVPAAIRAAAREHFVTPCGPCRQVTNEFEADPCAVILARESGEVLLTTLRWLLPMSFGPRNLGMDPMAYSRCACGHAA